MAAFDIGSKDSVQLVVKEADNQVVAYLNGNQIYEKIGVNAGSFEDRIDLDAQLKAGYNVFTLVGIRSGTSGPAFKVAVTRNDSVIANYDSHPVPSAPGNGATGLVFDMSLEFNRK
jgi:hypothetical protein